MKHLLRYIAGTLSDGCVYRYGDGESLTGFSDSDHAGDVDTRKSTSGVLFFLGGSLVSWQSQKQKVVATSSCEAEYIAAATAACQGVWLARLFGELMNQAAAPISLFIDNKSAISLCKNPVLTIAASTSTFDITSFVIVLRRDRWPWSSSVRGSRKQTY